MNVSIFCDRPGHPFHERKGPTTLVTLTHDDYVALDDKMIQLSYWREVEAHSAGRARALERLFALDDDLLDGLDAHEAGRKWPTLPRGTATVVIDGRTKFVRPCPCGDKLDVTEVKVRPVLDAIVAAGMDKISLRGLRARLR